MSDTISKYHELVEDGVIDPNEPVRKPVFIYESPDGGETVTRRPFGGDVSDREVIKKPELDVRKEAYRLLCEVDERVIRMANKILDIGE